MRENDVIDEAALDAARVDAVRACGPAAGPSLSELAHEAEERRIVKVVVALGALGVIGAVALPFADLFLRPRAGTTATGGRSTPHRPCCAMRCGRASTAERHQPPTYQPDHHGSAVRVSRARAPGNNDNERMRECRNVMPGFSGVEYIAKLHIEDHGVVRNSFRGGHSHLATTVWMTRSWSKDDFLNTLAARGQFGFGWRGVTVAASRYFGKQPSAPDTIRSRLHRVANRRGRRRSAGAIRRLRCRCAMSFSPGCARTAPSATRISGTPHPSRSSSLRRPSVGHPAASAELNPLT